MNSFTSYSNRDETLSEAAKLKEDQLIATMDGIISKVYSDNEDLKVAYDYYACTRDNEQYAFLEDNFGIGSPVDVEFTPLVRIHIDYLTGEQLSSEDKPMISCKDSNTLANIKDSIETRLKMSEIDIINAEWHKAITAIYNGENPPIAKIDDIMKKMNLEKKKIKDNFKSRFEIAAQKILTVLQQAKEVDLENKKKILIQDLLITGSCFYKVSFDGPNTFPDIEVINPLDIFFKKDTNKTYIKDLSEVAWRKYMTTQEIINKWGHLMTEDQKNDLYSRNEGLSGNSFIEVKSKSETSLTGYGFSRSNSRSSNYDYKNQSDVHEVWFAEWVSNNKVENVEKHKTVDGVGAKPKKYGYRLDRYEGIRINGTTYLNLGKSDVVQRTANAPYKCSLSVNGVCYSDRNSKPFSLVLNTKSLQDKYDILHFHKDTLIANSGVKGGYVDLAQIPKFLGDTPQERLLQWKAYKKTGDALLDSSQDGRGMAPNTIYSGYDDTVSGQAIQAIQLAIEQTELIVSSITGVFREKLGGIEARDAVSNVKAGLKQSSIITKPYFAMMQTLIDSLLSDSLNMFRLSFKDGFIGSSYLDNKSQDIISLNAEDYSLTDFDVHIVDYSEVAKDLEMLQSFSMELIKSNSADLDDLVKAITSKGLTEMKTELLDSIAEKKEEDDQIKQLSEQLNQLSAQMEKTNAELQKSQQENQKLKDQDRKLDQEKIDKEFEIKKEANRLKELEINQNIKNDERELDIEEAQLFDNNPFNDEVQSSNN